MKLLDLTDDEKRFCEYWLKYYSHLMKQLTNPVFTAHIVYTMIVYEANTRQRERVLRLLLGRYAKLHKNNLMKDIKRYMGGIDESSRANYRAISPYSSDPSRWPSNKTNVIESESTT